MKKILTILLCFTFLTNNLLALDSNSIKAKSAIVIEESTNKVIYEKNSNEKMAPASMTKIMTMLLICEALDNKTISLDDDVLISKNAASMGGSQIYLEEGKTFKVNDLLISIAVGSANDSAVAMAEKIGGSESNFVNMMNEKAKELGAVNTSFKNPHGLDEDGHYTTAYDMALIASALVKYDDILKYTSTYETTINHPNGNSLWLVNTNTLIKHYSGLDGLKTGYTNNAGYCLTGTMNRDGMRLISVVMNEESKEDRNTDTINLMEYSYSNYYKKKVLTNDKSLGTTFIDNASNRVVDYYLKSDASLIIDKKEKDITYNYEINIDNLKAPLKKNDKIGSLYLYYNNETFTYDIIVKDDIKKANIFNRFINTFKDIISGNVNNVIKSKHI